MGDKYCIECGYKLTLLFTSYACDRCDGKLPKNNKLIVRSNDDEEGWVLNLRDRWDNGEYFDPYDTYEDPPSDSD